MKSFKSIRESNSVEPGVSEIDDVQDDPMSFVEIKPKKTKAVKEGIVDTAAKAKARIFSSVNNKKNELYKNAVKEDILREAVSVKKEKHSWGTMMTVHHGSDTSYPLHPEHQSAIKKLRPGMKTTFKDETNSTVHAHREGDTVHLTRPKTSSTKTSIAHRHFNEETVVETKGAPKGFHFTKDGKLKRGDADQDGNGGPMLRSDPLDKLRNKVPPVSEKAEHVDEAQMSNLEIQHAVNLHSMLKNNNPIMAHSNSTKNAHISMVKKHGSSWRKKAGILEETEQMNEKLTSKDIKMAVGVAKDKRYAGGNMTGAVKTMEKIKPGLSKHPRVQQVLKSTNEGIDFLKVWESIKPVHEAIKTTHEDPLVVVRDAEGHIHTHANLSVANGIHGTDVKHQAIHSGKPVQAGKFTFELSQHHDGALKEDAPFDPVAHKKELDRLMAKHIEAHKAVSKAFADMKAQGKRPSFDIPENKKLNDIKQEIAQHRAKVPQGPAAKPGSPEHYYASKKPGEYTGD